MYVVYYQMFAGQQRHFSSCLEIVTDNKFISDHSKILLLMDTMVTGMMVEIKDIEKSLST